MCFSLQLIIEIIHSEQASSIGNETVPIQLAQCWFPGQAISDAKI